MPSTNDEQELATQNIGLENEEEAMSPSLLLQGMSNNEEEDETEITHLNVQNYKEEPEKIQPRMKKKKICVKDRLIAEVKAGRDERNKILQGFVEAQMSKSTTPKTDHPVDMFFLSMAQVVKTLPHNLIVEARTKVCQIVGELEYRALQTVQQTPSAVLPPFVDTSRPTTPALPTPLTVETRNLPGNIKVRQLAPSSSGSSSIDALLSVSSASDSEIESAVSIGHSFLNMF